MSLAFAVSDSRVRYGLARRLSALGEGTPPFMALQQALSQPQPTVARGVTRRLAAKIREIVAEEGLTAHSHPAGAGQRPGRVSTAVIVAAGAVVLVLGVAAVTCVSLRTYRALGNRQATTAEATPQAAAQASEGAEEVAPALSTRELAQLSMKSAVSLHCPSSVGSGFFVAPGTIMTNAHVLCEGGRGPVEVVLSSGRKLIGTPARVDRRLDLALVTVGGTDVAPLPLGDVADAEVGDRVVFVGSPVGLEFTVHEGSISSLARALRGLAYIQIDAKVNPGNSGGPLLDERGRVLGVVSLKHMGAEGIALVMPINYAYIGSEPLVPPPAAVVRSKRFEEGMAARARNTEAEEETAEDATTRTERLPMLVAASVDEYDRLIAHVVQGADSKPGYRMITLKAWVGTDVVCTMKGDINEWTVLDEKAPPLPLDRAIITELLKRRAMGPLFIGGAPLRWDLCPRERMHGLVVLELVDADPLLARLPVQVYSGGGGYRRYR